MQAFVFEDSHTSDRLQLTTNSNVRHSATDIYSWWTLISTPNICHPIQVQVSRATTQYTETHIGPQLNHPFHRTAHIQLLVVLDHTNYILKIEESQFIWTWQHQRPLTSTLLSTDWRKVTPTAHIGVMQTPSQTDIYRWYYWWVVVLSSTVKLDSCWQHCVGLIGRHL